MYLVRRLFTFTGGKGHFLPLLPFARVAVERGDEVLVSCQAAMLQAVRSAGFTAVDSGGATLLDPTARRPLLPVDRREEEDAIRDFFAGSIARERARRLLTIATNWCPDVIVRDEVDFGAAVIAEHLGIRHVSVVVLAAGGLIRADLLAPTLDSLRAEYALPPDPDLALLYGQRTLVPGPASFRHPDHPLPTPAHHIQPGVLTDAATATVSHAATSRTLTWLAQQPRRPTVYFTLGTVFHQESGDLFHRVMNGLGDMDANIVITVGDEINPSELGPPPANVHVERFIPQHALLPHCQAVISHAGSGSVIGALTFSVPLVLLPMGADQPWNAGRCENLGVARVLDPRAVTGQRVADAANEILTTPGYQHAAARIRDEIGALPTTIHAFDLM